MAEVPPTVPTRRDKIAQTILLILTMVGGGLMFIGRLIANLMRGGVRP